MSWTHFERLSPEEAINLAERLIGYYPAITASDPKVYTAGLVELFLSYSATVVRRSLSAASGIPAKHKRLPSIAEVREELSAAAKEAAEEARRAALGPARPDLSRRLPPPSPSCVAFGEMVQRDGRPLGRWEAGTAWERYVGHGKGGMQSIDRFTQIAEQARAALHAAKGERIGEKTATPEAAAAEDSQAYSGRSTEAKSA